MTLSIPYNEPQHTIEIETGFGTVVIEKIISITTDDTITNTTIKGYTKNKEYITAIYNNGIQTQEAELMSLHIDYANCSRVHQKNNMPELERWRKILK